MKADQPAAEGPQFDSPASTTLDELIALRGLASALVRRSRRRPASQAVGGTQSARLGRGLDFAEVRNYQPGDDVRMIDWKVTARTGQAHTKLFIEERERPFFIVVDYRASMRFGTRGMYKSVLAARLSAVLGWAVVANNDRVGGLVITDNQHYQVRPRLGRQGLMGLFRAIDHAQRRIPVHENAESLRDQLLRLRHLVHTGSSVCVLSDFDGFDNDSGSALGGVLEHSDVVAAMVQDPLDQKLPDKGVFAVSDEQRQLLIQTNQPRVRSHYQQRFQQHRDFVREFFSRRRGRFLPVQTDREFTDTARLLLAAAAIPSGR